LYQRLTRVATNARRHERAPSARGATSRDFAIGV
jgi:hypothetical protein